ncbi:hypothetical protein PVAP13_2NG413500 [Panicum virgatum]|uniref:Cathepsin propeptide inhibitor domain-containing protein n=1 Tax=Panicum virgatum TaxID=38727 RepID=A0A8T0VMS8_PANVG|nr:hypothetical protein PVAP13_2NG413500 [Panicum virgatum]
MSLRGLSSLLIRRFSPRRIPAAQAETIGSASGRPTLSPHSGELRKIHAPDEVPDSGKVAVKRVGNVMEVDDAVMKELFEESMKKHNEAYKNYWKMVREQEYKVDEEVMKKRFEDWMKEYGRTYKNEKEKARRYEAFKVNAINTDKLNAHSLGDARNRLNEYADWTEDEFRSMDCRHGDMDMKSYIEDTRTMYAEGRFGARPRKVTVTEPPITIEEPDCTDVVKKVFRELAARKAEQNVKQTSTSQREDRKADKVDACKAAKQS